MAEKMTRRTFMKSAAAAAAAISLSGVLVGCGGGSAAADEVKLGAYTVKLYSANSEKERGSNEIENRSKEMVRRCKAENTDGF